MSDLLNSASLVMVPSGYKEDTVYSVVPSDGSGDLSFTRASNGTRVNSAGLVEVCPWNLLQQSEAIGVVSPWANSNLTITANSVIAPNGTTTADVLTETTATTTQFRTQQTTPQSTNIYTLSVYVKNIMGTRQAYIDLGPVTGFFNFATETTYSASAIASFEKLADGWFRFSLTTATAITPSTVYVGLGQSNSETYTGNGTSAIAFWGAQLNIGATAKPYFPTTDRLNVPRLTYQNGGGGCPSLLLEKQSTNLVVQSNDMTQWVNGAGTMTKNATTSPDGTNNALSYDNSGDCSTFEVASNAVYSWSVFVKQGTSPTASIDMSDGATGDVITTFTFATKTFSGTSAGGSWTSPSTSYIECGNGWFRITLIATKNAGSSIGHKIIASGSGYTYVYGAQLEASSYPTSYIPTTSSSATRVADACFKTGISSLIGGTSGTVFFDIKTNPVLTSDNYKQFFYYTDSSANQGYMYLNSGNGIITNAPLGNLSSSITLSPNTRYKIALTYANNDFALYVNGVSVGTASSGTPWNFENLLSLGSYTGTVEFNQFVFNQYTHFKSRLTNAELASITSL